MNYSIVNHFLHETKSFQRQSNSKIAFLSLHTVNNFNNQITVEGKVEYLFY